MGLDRRYDPEVGDYIDDGAGGYEETDTVETAAYLQITIHRDEYVGDHSRGSDIHLLPRENADALTVLAAEDTLRAALQKLVDAGLAKDLEVNVSASEDFPHRLEGGTEITDAQRGRVDLSDVVGFGRRS